jgi:hypothetical protein
MVGGIVIEVAELKNRPEALFINCRESDVCGILVENNSNSQTIEIGDSIWWHGRFAYWTPQDSERTLQGINFDIKIPRIGYSGVKYEDCNRG